MSPGARRLTGVHLRSCACRSDDVWLNRCHLASCVTAKAGLAGLDGVSVALFADYDNDGYKDLFVSRTFRPNQLFHNNSDGTFSDVTKKSGIGEDAAPRYILGRL